MNVIKSAVVGVLAVAASVVFVLALERARMVFQEANDLYGSQNVAIVVAGLIFFLCVFFMALSIFRERERMSKEEHQKYVKALESEYRRMTGREFDFEEYRIGYRYHKPAGSKNVEV